MSRRVVAAAKGGIGLGKNVFCGLPLFYVNAVLVTGLLPLSRGAQVVMGTPQGYRGEGLLGRFWEIVERHRINFFSGVPTGYAALRQHSLDGHDVSSSESAVYGVAQLLGRFQEQAGLKVIDGYGLTEGTRVSACNQPLGDSWLGSIALRVPLQRMKAVVLNAEGSRVHDCATGEVGVLVIAGPNLFKGYLSAEHNQSLWGKDGNGLRWLNTGDLGRAADGYFYLTSGKKALIIRGGYSIDPAAIEEPLHLHPAMQLAAAVVRPDAHASEVPVAYVQQPPGSSASAQEVFDMDSAQVGMLVEIALADAAVSEPASQALDRYPLVLLCRRFGSDLGRRSPFHPHTRIVATNLP